MPKQPLYSVVIFDALGDQKPVVGPCLLGPELNILRLKQAINNIFLQYPELDRQKPWVARCRPNRQCLLWFLRLPSERRGAAMWVYMESKGLVRKACELLNRPPKDAGRVSATHILLNMARCQGSDYWLWRGLTDYEKEMIRQAVVFFLLGPGQSDAGFCSRKWWKTLATSRGVPWPPATAQSVD